LRWPGANLTSRVYTFLSKLEHRKATRSSQENDRPPIYASTDDDQYGVDGLQCWSHRLTTLPLGDEKHQSLPDVPFLEIFNSAINIRVFEMVNLKAIFDVRELLVTGHLRIGKDSLGLEPLHRRGITCHRMFCIPNTS